jgi:hypothetical protein
MVTAVPGILSFSGGGSLAPVAPTMTREDLVLFLVTFGATLFATIAVGLGGWRRQERALARLAALSELARSPLVTDHDRALLESRFRLGMVELSSDQYFRRALRVQQSIYLFCAGLGVALFWFGSHHSGSIKWSAYIGAIVLFLLGVSTTSVAPHRWHLPRFLAPQAESVVPKVMRSVMSVDAVLGLGNIKAANVVLFGSSGGRDIAAFREAVGDGGVVLVIDGDGEARDRGEILVSSQGWSNVEIRDIGAVRLRNGEFDVAVSLGGDLNGEPPTPLAQALRQCLTDTGRAIVIVRRRCLRKRRMSRDQVADAFKQQLHVKYSHTWRDGSVTLLCNADGADSFRRPGNL